MAPAPKTQMLHVSPRHEQQRRGRAAARRARARVARNAARRGRVEQLDAHRIARQPGLHEAHRQIARRLGASGRMAGAGWRGRPGPWCSGRARSGRSKPASRAMAGSAWMGIQSRLATRYSSAFCGRGGDVHAWLRHGVSAASGRKAAARSRPRRRSHRRRAGTAPLRMSASVRAAGGVGELGVDVEHRAAARALVFDARSRWRPITRPAVRQRQRCQCTCCSPCTMRTQSMPVAGVVLPERRPGQDHRPSVGTTRRAWPGGLRRRKGSSSASSGSLPDAQRQRIQQRCRARARSCSHRAETRWWMTWSRFMIRRSRHDDLAELLAAPAGGRRPRAPAPAGSAVDHRIQAAAREQRDELRNSSMLPPVEP
jgi:hypothetical protein